MPPSDHEPPDYTPEPGFRLAAPSPADGQAIWQLADAVGLDLNSPYAYVLWGEYFAETSVVAVIGEETVGFVTGFTPPADPTTLFVWQVGVAESARRTGLGARMLDHLVERTGARYVEATVTPDNEASAALFQALGRRNSASVDVGPFFATDLFPDGHQAEERFRIGPILRHAHQEKRL